LIAIAILDGLWDTLLSVVKALLPLLGFFLIFQFLFLKLPRHYIFNLLKGTLLAVVGLLLFLQGVHIGFLPVGEAIGEVLGNITQKWLLIPFGFFIGSLTTWTEPAVRILCNQVEKASAAVIRKDVVLYAICSGVALFVGLGMAKIIYGIPLLYIVVPGYIIALVMLWFSDKEFLSIAFDAGGVATGPMAVTFLMAIAIGVSSAIEGRDPVIHGFGLIALIALAPVLSVMALGVIFRLNQWKGGRKMESDISLIVTIVGKGWGDTVLEASMKAGAEGGTILLGRGVGVHEKREILGICIEPEREVVLSVTYPDKKEAILQEIVRAAELEKPGAGIAFVVPVEKVVGVVHRFHENFQPSSG
jgi:nitrogen regulatory protein PII